MIAGAAFAVWWLIPGLQNGLHALSVVLERLFLSGGFTLGGLLFILDAKFNPRHEGHKGHWVIRNLRLLITIGIPLLVVLVVTAHNLPIVLTRVDDGIRTARLIDGHGADLIWAPQGPGWNWKQDFGGYPSWDSLAFFGVQPPGLDSSKREDQHATEKDMSRTGLCAFLDEEGLILLSEPQYIWRCQPLMKLRGRSAGTIKMLVASGMAKSDDSIANYALIKKPPYGHRINLLFIIGQQRNQMMKMPISSVIQAL